MIKTYLARGRMEKEDHLKIFPIFLKEKRSIDFTEEIRSRTEELASKKLNLRSIEIWKIITDKMDKKRNTWKGVSSCQVKN